MITLAQLEELYPRARTGYLQIFAALLHNV